MPDDLSRRITEAKLARALGQGEIEREAGLTQGTLSRLESGDRGKNIGAALAIRLARALRVRVEWLVLGDPPRDQPAAQGEVNASLPGWAEALAEARRQQLAPPVALDAVSDLPVLVRPEAVTPEYVEGIARIWYRYAPTDEKIARERARYSAAEDVPPELLPEGHDSRKGRRYGAGKK